MLKISAVKAREILDSRGDPTVETTVFLTNGETAISSVPSGASKGSYEAWELRDNDQRRFNGLGVLQAVAKVNDVIGPKIVGQDPRNQLAIDQLLISLDGTANKSRLGANAVLSVSEAVCKAAAKEEKVPLYEHVGHLSGLKKEAMKIPTPIFNLINGGRHGAGNLDFQEFHVIPQPATSYAQVLETGEEIYQAVKTILKRQGAIHSVGDEGGFAPNLFTNSDALEVLVQAIKEAGFERDRDVFLGLDVAAASFYREGRYQIRDRTQAMETDELIAFYQDLCQQYPLWLLEDPLQENDWQGWIKLKQLLTSTTLVGDDLLATNKERVQEAIRRQACGAVLIKPNQIGTVAETIEVIKIARTASWKIAVSHRSGETNDDFVADFAVGVGADFVKFGAPARGERVAKYNRLLKIEEELIANSNIKRFKI